MKNLKELKNEDIDEDDVETHVFPIEEDKWEMENPFNCLECKGEDQHKGKRLILP